MIIREVTLQCQEGSSDKFYHLMLSQPEGNGPFIVHAEYGRNGSTGQTAIKGNYALMNDAMREFEKVQRSKEAKGYYVQGGMAAATGRVGVTSTPTIDRDIPLSSIEFPTSNQPVRDRWGAIVPTPARIDTLPQLLDEIEEEAVEGFINDPNYVAQQKFDGKRMILKLDPDGLHAFNRRGLECGFPSAYNNHFPESRSSGSCIGLTLDGESVGDDFYAFDMLATPIGPCTSWDYNARLQQMLVILGHDHTWMVPTARTTAEKRNLYETLKATNAEGIVFKPLSYPYKSGHGVGVLKYKFYATCTCVVLDRNTQRSVKLGLKQNAVYSSPMIPVGNCTIPPNKEVPEAGTCVEIRYLYAYEGGSLYQPTYIGVRDDMIVADCLITQLKYKGVTTARTLQATVSKPKTRRIIF